MSPEMTDLPYLLDFYPLQSPEQTRIHPFFDHLREGRFTTTRCTGCGALLWQPRVVCPHCNGDAMEWVDLPTEGRVHASTVVHHGLPLGMEDEAPLGIGIVELDVADLEVPDGEGQGDGVGGGRDDEAHGTLRLLSRIDGAAGLAIGDAVRLKIVDLPDGRIFYRFEAVERAGEE